MFYKPGEYRINQENEFIPASTGLPLKPGDLVALEAFCDANDISPIKSYKKGNRFTEPRGSRCERCEETVQVCRCADLNQLREVAKLIASRSQVCRNTPFNYVKIARETHEKRTKNARKL